MEDKSARKIQKEAKRDFSYALNETGEYREPWRIFRIMAEFVEGYQFLSQFEKEVTVLGSARLSEKNKYYQMAEKLGFLLGQEKYTVITGGGPGIMEASNKGAAEGGGISVGLNIQLPFEQRVNPYVQKSIAFHYFFTRKVMLTSPSQAFVVFPGGFGTMDEFFEIIDMMQIGKMHRIPVILVGSEYWNPLLSFLRQGPVKIGSVSADELDFLRVVDSAEDAYQEIKKREIDPKKICELSPMNFRCSEGLDWKIFRIMSELVDGFEFLTGLVEAVNVLGTKNISEDSVYYKAAHQLGANLAGKKFAAVTGGCSGVAEATNKGAFEAGGQSIGINMEVGGKTINNSFLTKSVMFKFPFVRKLIVTAPSKAFVFFPGGLGTMHHLFEVLTLIQTKKMPKLPIILVDHDFWLPLHEFIKKVFVHKFETVTDDDDELYQMVDKVDTVVDIIDDFRR